jgi:hypothetical protein
MKCNLSRFGVLSLLPLVAACDSRADDDYRGEALLHLEGRVVIADPNAPDDLVPALLFPGPNGQEVLDVTARGDFPNNFSLEVFAPPPESALFTIEDEAFVPAGTKLGLAYITAISREHPKKFVLAGLVETASAEDLPACADAEPACQRIERWCADESREDCRIVGITCDGDCPPAYSSGNPAIQINDDSAADMYAGLSEHHLILWTDKGLPKDTVFAQLLGLKEDVAPGYALIEVDTSKDDPELDQACAGEDCVELFTDAAVERYNEIHGTDYQNTEDPRLEALPEDEYDRVDDALAVYALEIALEQGYDISELQGTRVIHDETTKLRIRIAPGIEPWAL